MEKLRSQKSISTQNYLEFPFGSALTNTNIINSINQTNQVCNQGRVQRGEGIQVCNQGRVQGGGNQVRNQGRMQG